MLAALALVGATSTQRELYWSAVGALIGLLLVAVVWSWLGINWLRISRRTLTRTAYAGQELTEEFVVTNLSRLPKLWLEVRDDSTLPHYFPSRVIGWIAGKSWRGWRAQTMCLQRGEFELGPIEVVSGDPLGIFQRSQHIDKVTRLLVYPSVFDLRTVPLKNTYLPSGEVLRNRTQHITTNAAGVREYVSGDSLNRIHWRLSQKRNQLIVKEFEIDPTSEFWIVLDLYQMAHVNQSHEMTLDAQGNCSLPRSTEEYAVSLASSIARHFLRKNRVLGLIGYAEHRILIQPDRGERQVIKTLERLASVEATGQVPFERLLREEANTLPRGSTVILITPSLDEAWAMMAAQLARRSMRALALIVDPSDFSAPPIQYDLTTLQNILGTSGVTFRVIRFGDDFDRVLSA